MVNSCVATDMPINKTLVSSNTWAAKERPRARVARALGNFWTSDSAEGGFEAAEVPGRIATLGNNSTLLNVQEGVGVSGDV